MATSSSSSNDYLLPEDIVIEILSWLLPKSLVRFKSVCKHWYSLITRLIKDPKFVAKHLNNAHTNNISSPTTIVIHIQIKHRFSITLAYLTPRFQINGTNKEEDNFDCVPLDINLEQLFGGSRSIFERTAFHCNGIICFVGKDFIVLYNPSLAQLKKFFLKSDDDDDVDDDVDELYTHGIGFGWDSVGDTYKFVRILSSDYDNCVAGKVEVYNFNGSNEYSRREIEFPKQLVGKPRCISNHAHVYYKGACYWLILGWKRGAPNNMLLSFDLASEVFHTKPFPIDLQMPVIGYASLVVWDDSLYLFAIPIEEVPKCIHVWVMNANYGGEIWRHHATIKAPFEGMESPLIFWKSTNELLMDIEDSEIVSYDLCTQKIRNLYNYGVNAKNATDTVVYSGHYVKSLVSIAGKEDA